MNRERKEDLKLSIRVFDYFPFEKNFYVEVKEIKNIKFQDVVAYRKKLELEIIVVDGKLKRVPKPIKTWTYAGLSTTFLNTIRNLNYYKPLPIQAQALPIIMSGRDCIAVANKGSGKTLAFVLPMLTHIMQPTRSLKSSIGLVITPTPDKIYNVIQLFIRRVLFISCIPVYGLSTVPQKLDCDLEVGPGIVVCTPDVISTPAFLKLPILNRVTYLVLDEADHMFHMGFEPQLRTLVQTTREDRQSVVFCTTFPPQLQVFARDFLENPVEIHAHGLVAALATASADSFMTEVQANPETGCYETELEINGFSIDAMWKVTRKDTQAHISDSTGASITTKGQYIRFPKIPPPRGERKLYLSIVGPTQQSVESAKAELNGLLLQEPSFPSSPSPSQQLVPNPYVDAFMRITLN